MERERGRWKYFGRNKISARSPKVPDPTPDDRKLLLRFTTIISMQDMRTFFGGKARSVRPSIRELVVN